MLDEALLFIVTNYNVTVFFKRSRDPSDARVWASDPAWADQVDPPARAAWLNSFREAQQVQSWKTELLRTNVPPTERQARWRKTGTDADSLSASTCSTNPSAASDQTTFTLKRKHGEQLHASSGEGSEQAIAADTTPLPSRKRQRISAEHALEPSTGALASVISPCVPAPAAEDILLLSELGLTDELITSSPYGYTLKVNPQAFHQTINLRRRHTQPAIWLTLSVSALILVQPLH